MVRIVCVVGKKPPSGISLEKKKPSVPLFKTPTPLRE